MLKNRIVTWTPDTLVALQKLLDDSDAETFEFERSLLDREFMEWSVENIAKVFAASPGKGE